MTISPTFANPYNTATYAMPQAPVQTTTRAMMQAPVAYSASAPMQMQAATNISPNAKGEPDLVCSAKYDAQTKTVCLSSFERGWLDSNIWYTIKADGSGDVMSAWGQKSVYPAGTFSNVFNKAQETYYTQGKISEDTALDLVKDTRAAVDVARENGAETSYLVTF